MTIASSSLDQLLQPAPAPTAQPTLQFVPAPPPAASDIHFEVVTIDPATAVQLLQRNTRNRKVKESKVREYAEDIRSGR